MPSSKISRIIRYYRECYQASFHTSEGHGIFDRDDVVPLATYLEDSADTICLTDSQLSAWLVDSDQTELILFSGFVLHPSPNRSFTTEVHYAPIKVFSTFDLISNSLKNPSTVANRHFLSMLQSIELSELQESAASYDDILTKSVGDKLKLDADKKPKPEKLKRWLVAQAKSLDAPVHCNLQVLALVPKDLRSYRAKEEFVGHLDCLADEANNSEANPLLHNLLLRKPSNEQSQENTSLLYKGAKLGFGEKLALPSLSVRQSQSIQNALKHRVSLLQGPPGTGKTHALASLTVVLASLNKSILLTAQSDAALDVLQQQLVETLNVDRSLIVRFGKGQRHGRFAQQAKRLIKQTDTKQNGEDVLSEFESLLELFKNIRKSQETIEASIDAYPIPSTELLIGNGGLGERLKRWFFWQRQHRNQGSLMLNIRALHQAINQHHTSLGAAASAVLKQRFQRAFSKDPTTWAKQCQNIGKSSVHAATQKMKANSEYPVILQSGLGIWLAKLDDVPECTYGNFDWVIVDEATQANMASVLPALAIAKSLVVSGDPRQLRHYSFLSNAQEERIEQQLDLQSESLPRFRSTSFYDFVHDSLMSTGQSRSITLLDEHYRSAPPLMQFNSEQFYDDQVKVLTGLEEDSGNTLHLNWQYVNGQRVDKVNDIEAKAVVQYLKVLMQKQAEKAEIESIGVLSFFADQTEALKKMVLCELSLQQIKDHQIKIGTPFSFQGAERDHMLISCAVDKDSVAGTWTYLNRPDVFNVATSRARTQQTLFLSVPPKELPGSSVLRRYHDFSLPKAIFTKPESLEPWLSPLVNALATINNDVSIELEHHHKIADIEVDLLLRHDNKRLAIDLIGFPGDKGVAVHLSRYSTLERVGISLYPLTAFDWMFNPDQVLADVKTWLHHDSNRLNESIESVRNKKRDLATQFKAKSDSVPKHMTLVNENVWLNFVEYSQAPELSITWGFDLNDMYDKLSQMDQLLPKLFKSSSVSYLRYKSAINTALTPYMENLSTYRLLHAQVWEANTADTEYWTTLTKPIIERHNDITDVLFKLHREMQIEVAKGGKLEAFALEDIEELALRLKKY